MLKFQQNVFADHALLIFVPACPERSKATVRCNVYVTLLCNFIQVDVTLFLKQRSCFGNKYEDERFVQYLRGQ